MFFTCCGRKSEGESENWAGASYKQSSPGSSPQPTHQTAAQMMNSQHPTNQNRTRTTSTSSFASLKSIQSFYSAKSEDDGDFYSVCSDGSRDRY